MNNTLSKKLKQFANTKAKGQQAKLFYKALKKNYLTQSGDDKERIRKALDKELSITVMNNNG